MAFYGVVPEGTRGHVVTIEAQVNLSAPTKSEAMDIRLLGLPQTALRQGIPRWQNALKNSGLSYPKYEVTINLAPANLPKPDTTLEAPIAAILGILGQTTEDPEEVDVGDGMEPEAIRKLLDEIRSNNRKRRETLHRVFQSDWVIIGELRLSGDLKTTRSLLGMISKAPRGARIIVPEEAEKEASLLLFRETSAQVYCASSLRQVVEFILGENHLAPIKGDLRAIIRNLKKNLPEEPHTQHWGFGDIAGQENAKRAIEVAVAGGHSVLLFGPPGEGKTRLAEAIPTIMPILTLRECFEINQIYSAKGLLRQGQIETVRPFRVVHPSASMVNLLGGTGAEGYIEPGEISLSHHGVLFLDELPQFPRDTLENLRAPIAQKRIVIGRASGSVEFMCNFALVAAMNPCPDGYYGEYECAICSKTIWKPSGECEDHPEADTIHKCRCTKSMVDSHLRRLSGPFLDRIDLKIRVFSLNPEQRFASTSAESSETVRQRVKRARHRQTERYKGLSFSVNAEVDNMRSHLHLMQIPATVMREFEKIQGEKRLSFRGAVKVIQIARTIADLGDKEEISIDHILQAMGLMGSSFNETEIQIETESELSGRRSERDQRSLYQLKERVLTEIGRRRLSKNRCAREMDLTLPTFNKVLRGETNISSGTITKMTAWLQESSGKTFRSRGR